MFGIRGQDNALEHQFLNLWEQEWRRERVDRIPSLFSFLEQLCDLFIHSFIYSFIHSFMAALGLRCCGRAFSSCGERGLLCCSARASSCCGAPAPGVRASVVAAFGLSSCGTWALEHEGLVVVAHRLSCSAACGIFPDQGSNLWTLHWQADS